MPDTDCDPFFDKFKRTPDQERWNDIRNRLLELERVLVARHPKRAEKLYYENGGRTVDWDYGLLSQRTEVAFHESEDDDGLALLDEAGDALSLLEPSYRSGAAMDANELDNAERGARKCAEHLGVDYDGIFLD